MKFVVDVLFPRFGVLRARVSLAIDLVGFLGAVRNPQLHDIVVESSKPSPFRIAKIVPFRIFFEDLIISQHVLASVVLRHGHTSKESDATANLIGRRDEGPNEAFISDRGRGKSESLFQQLEVCPSPRMSTLKSFMTVHVAMFSDKSVEVGGDCGRPRRLPRVPLRDAATVRPKDASPATPDNGRLVGQPSRSINNGSMVVVQGVVDGV